MNIQGKLNTIAEDFMLRAPLYGIPSADIV